MWIKYKKGIVAAVGAVFAILAVQFGGASWLKDAVAVATALGVYSIPNG